MCVCVLSRADDARDQLFANQAEHHAWMRTKCSRNAIIFFFFSVSLLFLNCGAGMNGRPYTKYTDRDKSDLWDAFKNIKKSKSDTDINIASKMQFYLERKNPTFARSVDSIRRHALGAFNTHEVPPRLELEPLSVVQQIPDGALDTPYIAEYEWGHRTYASFANFMGGEQNQKAIEMAKELLQTIKLGEHKHPDRYLMETGLRLNGPPGSGKGHLVSAILNEMHNDGINFKVKHLKCGEIHSSDKAKIIVDALYTEAAVWSLRNDCDPFIVVMDECECLFTSNSYAHTCWMKSWFYLRRGETAPFVIVIMQFNKQHDFDGRGIDLEFEPCIMQRSTGRLQHGRR